MKSLLKPSLIRLVTCIGMVGLLLGCGSDNPTPDPAGPTSAASPMQSETQSPAEQDREQPSNASTEPDIPDRYSTPAPVIAAEPWTGPRPEVPITSFSEKAFNSAWQIDLQVKDKPLVEVLEQITSPVTGWNPQIVLGPEENTRRKTRKLEKPAESVLQTPITLELFSVSRLEAIERACELAGVYPEYGYDREFAENAKPVLRLLSGPRSRALGFPESETKPELVCFAGPIMIEVSQLKELPPYGMGIIELRISSLPLPTPVRSLLQGPATKFHAALLPGGENVLASQVMTARYTLPMTVDVTKSSYYLQHLLQDVTLLEQVTGEVTLPIPNSAQVVWLDSMTEGVTAETEGVVATLKGISSSANSWFIRYSVVSDRNLEGLAAFAYDAEGSLIKTDSYGTSWAPMFNQGSGSLNVSVQPRMLAVVVINKQTTYQTNFALKNLPLTKFEEQPASLPALSFGEFDRPVDIAVHELSKENLFKEVQMTLVNHSNKDVRDIEITMHYLDASGNRLRDNPTTISATLESAHDPYPILIKAGTSVKKPQTAYFCPDETEQVKVSIQGVTFADLQRWEAPTSAR